MSASDFEDFVEEHDVRLELIDLCHRAYLRGKQQETSTQLAMARDRIQSLEAELERMIMRLASCSTVAMANTRDSATVAREMHGDYRSAALEDVIRAVDAEMDYRERAESLEAPFILTDTPPKEPGWWVVQCYGLRPHIVLVEREEHGYLYTGSTYIKEFRSDTKWGSAPLPIPESDDE